MLPQPAVAAPPPRGRPRRCGTIRAAALFAAVPASVAAGSDARAAIAPGGAPRNPGYARRGRGFAYAAVDNRACATFACASRSAVRSPSSTTGW